MVDSQSAPNGASPPDSMSVRKAAVWLVAIYFASALLRHAANDLQGLPMIYSDELGFIEAGRSILDFRGIFWNGQPMNYPSWLYPMLIALPMRWAGELNALGGIYWFNAFAISTAIPLAYGLARRLLSRARSVGVAGLTALLASMSYASVAMAENVYFPLAIAGLWAALAALDRPTVRRCLLAGALFGLLYHAKPQGLFYPIFFGIAVVADALLAPGLTGRERFRAVAVHGLTALAWGGVAALRFAEAVLERMPHPISVGAFLGSYTERAMGDYPLDPKTFALMTLCNIDVAIVAVGILPALRLAWDFLPALRGEFPRPRRQMIVLTAAAAAVAILASARHTVIADPDICVYERYLMFFFPPLFILFLAGGPPLSRGRRRAGWLVAVAATVGAVAIARWRLDLILTDIPSFGGYWLRWPVGEHLIAARIGLAVLIAAGLGLWAWLARAERAQRWRPRIPALAVVWILLILNYGCYLGNECVLKQRLSPLIETARKIRREIPAGDRLLILADGLPQNLYFQIHARLFAETVFIHWNQDYWFSHPLQINADGTMSGRDLKERLWLFAEARIPIEGQPVSRIGRYNLYDLAQSPPPRMNLERLKRIAPDATPAQPAPGDPAFPADLRLTWLSVDLPRVWRAGERKKISIQVRNDSPFALAPGDWRYAIGYHWANYALTGKWEAIVWDDGQNVFFPDTLAPGAVADLTLAIQAPDRPAKQWVLTLGPLLIGDAGRVWPMNPELEKVLTLDLAK